MVSSTPKVSVVIPTYNRADFLPDAIDSVLRQTLTDLELIVVDDGSTDSSAEVLAAIDDERLRYVRRPHGGISAALNTGLAAATGEYYARLDSDDLWDPEMLATLARYLERRPELGFVYGRGRVIRTDGQEHSQILGLPPRYPDDGLRSLLYDDCTCNVAVLARRACITEAGPYDESLIAHEDWDIWLRMALSYPFHFVDRVLATVRRHDSNLTGKNSDRFEQIVDTRRIPLDKVFSRPDLPLEATAMRSIAYTNVELFTGRQWLGAGDRRRAFRAFSRAVLNSRNPLLTAARVAWLVGAVPAVTRTSFGRSALVGLAALRRRLRAARGGS